MSEDGSPRVGALVLAAGAGSRFGGGKLLALHRDRPILQHVLDTLAAARVTDVVVVLGEDAAAVEHAIAWRDERRVANPRPLDGLASSLRIGVASVAALEPPPDALLVALGDQPLLRADVIDALVAALPTTDRPVIVPRYADDAARNPVLLLRAAWPLAASAQGDRGLGPLLLDRGELVHEVPVGGDNPDVDTRADLDRLAVR